MPEFANIFMGVMDQLRSDETLMGLAENKVYLSFAPKNSLPPLVVVTPIADDLLSSFERDHARVDFQIDCYASSKNHSLSLAQSISERVFELLNRQEIVTIGWELVICNCTQRGLPIVDDDANFRVLSQYRVYASGDDEAGGSGSGGSGS